MLETPKALSTKPTGQVKILNIGQSAGNQKFYHEIITIY